MSAGVMTPWKKNLLNLYVLLRKQVRLLRHSKRQYAESCEKKEPIDVYCDKFVRINKIKVFSWTPK